MAQVVKHFSFNTNTTLPYTAEGGSWAATVAGSAAASISTAEDSANDTNAGNGVLDLTNTARNNASAGNYWEWTGALTALGVPSGALVTAIDLDYDKRVSAATGPRSGSIRWGPATLRDATGASTLGTFSAQSNAQTTTDGSYSTVDGAAVTGLAIDSGTTVKLRIEATVGTANTSPTNVQLRFDWIVVTVTYTTDVTVTVSAAVAAGSTPAPTVIVPVHRTHTFEAGVASGTAIDGTNSATGGNAFTSAVGTPTYSNTRVKNGSLAMGVTTPGTFSNVYVDWQSLGAITSDVWFRGYFYFPSYPSASVRGLMLRTSAANCAFLSFGQVTTDQKINMLDAGQSSLCQGTVNYATGQWIRVECRIRPATSNGQVEWRLYNTADAAVGSWDDTSSNSTAVLAANIDQVRWGANTATGPASYTFYMDDIALSTDGWIGPSSTPPVVLPQQKPVVVQQAVARSYSW